MKKTQYKKKISQHNSKKQKYKAQKQLNLLKNDIKDIQTSFVGDDNLRDFANQIVKFIIQWNHSQNDEQTKNQCFKCILEKLENIEKSKFLKKLMLENECFLQQLDIIYPQVEENVLEYFLQFHYWFFDKNPELLNEFFNLKNFEQFLYNVPKIIDAKNKEKIINKILQLYSKIVQQIIICKKYWYEPQSYWDIVQNCLIQFLENQDFLQLRDTYVLDVFRNENFLKYSLDKQIQFSPSSPCQTLEKSYHIQYFLGLTKYLWHHYISDQISFFLCKKILPYLQFFDNTDNRKKTLQILFFQMIYNIYLQQKNECNRKNNFGSIDKIQFQNLRMYDYCNHSDLFENQMFIQIFGSDQKITRLASNYLVDKIQCSFDSIANNFNIFYDQNKNQVKQKKSFIEENSIDQIYCIIQKFQNILQTKEFEELTNILRQLEFLVYDQFQNTNCATYYQNLLHGNYDENIIKTFSIGCLENLENVSKYKENTRFNILKEYQRFTNRKIVYQFYVFFCDFVEKVYLLHGKDDSDIINNCIYVLLQKYGMITDILAHLVEKVNIQNLYQNQKKRFFKSVEFLFQDDKLKQQQVESISVRLIKKYNPRLIYFQKIYKTKEPLFSDYKSIQIQSLGFKKQSLQDRIKFFYKKFQKLQKWYNCSDLYLDREKMYDQVKKYFKQTDTKELRNSLQIQYKIRGVTNQYNERREFFYQMGKIIFSKETGLFDQISEDSSNFYISEFWKKKNIDEYYFVGQFLAVCIIDKQNIAARMQDMLLKMILNKHIVFEDYKKFDKQYYKSLKYMIDNDVDKSMNLCFEILHRIDGQEKTILLKKNGDKVMVSNDNKKKYIFKLIVFLTYEKYKEAIDKLIDGFHSIIPAGLLQLFNSEELSNLISGEPIIYANELTDNMICFGGYTKQSNTIQLLFKYLNNLEQDKKEGQNMLRGFLEFVTGSRQIPYRFLKNLNYSSRNIVKIYVCSSSKDINFLPTSTTCTNRICLPEYPTYELLKNKLDTAIKYGKEGFAFFQLNKLLLNHMYKLHQYIVQLIFNLLLKTQTINQIEDKLLINLIQYINQNSF